MFGIKGLLWKYNIVTQELRYSALSCTWHVALFKKAWRWDWERIQLNIVQHVGMLYNRQSEHLVVKNIHVLKISTIATKLWNMFCQYTVNLTSQYIFTNLFLTLSLLWYPLNQRCLICILSINSHLYSSNTKHLGHIYEETNACLNVSNDLIVECSSFLINWKQQTTITMISGEEINTYSQWCTQVVWGQGQRNLKRPPAAWGGAPVRRKLLWIHGETVPK